MAVFVFSLQVTKPGKSDKYKLVNLTLTGFLGSSFSDSLVVIDSAKMKMSVCAAAQLLRTVPGTNAPPSYCSLVKPQILESSTLPVWGLQNKTFEC